MIEAWNEKQILENMPEPYRFLYHKVKDEYLLPNEEILFGAYCSTPRWKWYESGWSLSTISGVVFITSNRYLRTGVSQKNGVLMNNTSIVYRKQGKRGWLDFSGDNRPFAEWEWILPHTEIPKKWIGFVIELPLDSISDIKGRKKITIEYQQETIDLLEIEFDDDWWLTFEKANGDYIYELLQVAHLSNGEIQTSPSHKKEVVAQEKSIADELKKLIALYEDKLITKEEFEKAKKKVLH
jgi:hypothetical protein